MRLPVPQQGVLRSILYLTVARIFSETAKWLAECANQPDMLRGRRCKSGDKDDVLAHVLLDLSVTVRSYSIEAGQSVLDQMGKRTVAQKRRVEGVYRLEVTDIPPFW